MLKSFDFDSSVDRTKGVQATTDGAWFQVVGDIPITLKASLNEQSGIQFSVVPYQIYNVPFRLLYLFHAAGLAARTFTILSGSADNRPTPIIPGQLRSGDFFETVRTPSIFKNNQFGAGTSLSTLWAIPAGGKRIRLMGFSMDLSGDASCAAAAFRYCHITDTSVGRLVFTKFAYVPAAAPAVPGGVLMESGLMTLGENGYVVPAGSALQFGISAALTSGQLNINAWGTEEL